MANIKFSQFTGQAATNTTYIVGFDGTANTKYNQNQMTDFVLNGEISADRTVGLGASNNLTFTGSGTSQVIFSSNGGAKVDFNFIVDGQAYGPINTIASGSTIDIFWNTGNVQTVELTGATTINDPSQIQPGATYILILKQDTTGGHTVTWGSKYKFPGGTPPTLTTTGDRADVITLVAYSADVLMCTSVLDFVTS